MNISVIHGEFSSATRQITPRLHPNWATATLKEEFAKLQHKKVLALSVDPLINTWDGLATLMKHKTVPLIFPIVADE